MFFTFSNIKTSLSSSLAEDLKVANNNEEAAIQYANSDAASSGVGTAASGSSSEISPSTRYSSFEVS